MSNNRVWEDRFPYPEEVELPDELEGWTDMYPSYYQFNRTEARGEYEKSLWWVHDHATTDPLSPWDVTVSADAWQTGWAQNTSRVLPIPTAMSVEIRLIAGYAYTAGTVTEDEDLVAEREEVFDERFEYWVEHFETLYEESWKPAVKEIIEEIRDIDVPEDFPRYASDEVVRESRGQEPVVDVLEAYDRLVELALEGWQRHFEFLPFSYLIYLEFDEFCNEKFPQIPDTAVTKMVAASEADVYMPDEKLNELAELAVDLGDDVTEVLCSEGPAEEKLAQLTESEAGRTFREALADVEDPWFYMSNGDGFHSYHGSWIDDYETPLHSLQSKIDRLENGETLHETGTQRAEEAEALFEEYKTYLTSEEEKAEFERLFTRCREIYYYAEDHNFWIDHRLNTLVFRKMREFGDLLVEYDVLADSEDIFLFTRYEVAEMLEELLHTWALGPTGFAPTKWREDAKRRAELMEAAKEWDPVPAIGDPPATIEDPLLEALNGITQETVDDWLDGDDDDGASEIEGLPASDGTAEGTARVVTSVSDLDCLETGDILVCPLMGPSWAPAFDKVRGVVTDMGGVSSHAAVVCREYGLPAVVSAGNATNDIESGDRIRIDGSTGTVEVLSNESEN